MKKIFIALSVLAALTFGVGSALAVPGVPDNSPGSDFTVPFLVSQARVVGDSGPTTVLNLTEVSGRLARFHIMFYSTKSKLGPTDEVDITPWGTVMLDIGKIIKGFSADDRKGLEIAFEGEVYYAGYINGQNFAFNNATKVYDRGVFDNVIGSFYYVDLSGGKAGASNLPMREAYNQQDAAGRYWETWAITQASPDLIVNNNYPNFSGRALYERWSGIALSCAQNVMYNGFTWLAQYGDITKAFPDWWWAPTAAWFAFYPEYYMLDDTGSTTFVLYQNGLPNVSSFHMYVINAAEDYKDTSVTIDEVTFIDAGSKVPDGLKVTYPYQGIFNWTSTNPLTSIADDTILWTEFLGWSWQKADNGATSQATNWTIMKQMARDAGTILNTMAPEPF